ncbi:nucleoside triphosphate pyrophosphohydrolase [Cohaesibacter celericrescens]|uniref:Nucleoside triphosphate pyrophosphohydrolase n=1 Tax=Cohaesibacter celericrescens TaxID=2067669 RepID=A0A2N5XTD9_9HYPH|nr:nucleoside triphosphate pyrophosphohydrolase [Cohaesibacter celericrescens]PLW77740.1 nucleoside triphosphate pyrophosphohydrolase [Cohaesibacter celericrescens]
MAPSRDIAILVKIMARLRDKDTGCPWDIEQDFASVIPYTIEEAYEVQDAIERNDLDDLRDELGDLLLQVVFHAQMANELQGDRAAFDFGDVVYAITQKMIRRHPHVFGDAGQRGKKLVREAWETIKQEEKEERAARRAELGLDESTKGFLDDVPRGLPAMKAAVKLQKQASKVGFDWNDPLLVLDKISEEIEEVREELSRKEAVNEQAVKSEIGDLLFAVTNLARHAHVDPEEALARTNQKFRDRFGYIEAQLIKHETSLPDATLEEMEKLWQEAKEK